MIKGTVARVEDRYVSVVVLKSNSYGGATLVRVGFNKAHLLMENHQVNKVVVLLVLWDSFFPIIYSHRMIFCIYFSCEHNEYHKIPLNQLIELIM